MSDLEAACEATIEAFSGISLKKPKLSPKLLSKPPFRFLHDLVTNVTKATGFGEGLYEGDELNSKAITDKPSKIAYLQKIVDCINNCQGGDLDVRCAKVVAGLEPENTNTMLQALAKCASDGSHNNWDSAVQQCLGGGGSEAKGEAKSGAKDEPAPAPAPAPAPEAKAESKTVAPAPEAKANKDEPAPAPSGGGGGGGGVDLSGVTGDFADTRAALEPLFSKPKLPDKLLGKPPFRFIHDIFSAVIKCDQCTSFAPGLYTPEQMDSKQVKDKASKLNYLTLMINVVGIQLGCPIEARPQKIVAGLESDLTNKFLQMLAICATSGQDMSDAVSRAKAGEGPPAESASAAPAPAPAAESKDAPAPAPAAKADSKSAPTPSEPEPAAEAKGLDSKAEEPAVAEAKTAADGEVRKPRMGRPTTARRRPPKQKDNVTATTLNDNKPIEPPKGIMMDGDDGMSDDEEEEVKGDADLDAKFAPISAGGPKGRLVQDIEGEMKEDAQAQAKKAKAGEDAKDGGGGIRLGRLKKSSKEKKGNYGFTESEITELRRSIQVLCQATNPLGKCMDHVHDDMEMMNKELEQWKSEYRRNVELMEEETKKTEESLQPQELQLVEVDQQVEEMVKKINAVKANISKNDVRIQQLLRMVVNV